MVQDHPEYTAQQQAAIETRSVSVALSAGAGTGKTFVLTQRFLSHLQPGPHAAQLVELVAITFTDRAAREMRDRIRQACRARLRSCPAAEVEYWLSVLYGLETARIATIHSFCTSLLRGHAVEAGLDPRFTVGDAAQTDVLLQRSARDSLHRLLERQHDDAMMLVLHFGLERSRDLLADLIGQRFRCSRNLLTTITKDSCAVHWADIWQKHCAPLLFQEFFESALCETIRHWLKDHQPKPNTVMFDRCRTVKALLAQPWAEIANPQLWLETLREEAKVQGGGGKSAWNDPEDLEELQSHFKELRERADKCLDKIVINLADLPAAAELTERASRLAAAAIDDYEQLKRKLGWLDFDDLLLKARDLLRDHPQVARRLAQGIKLLMVDEFQDTDPVQADIVRSLTGPALQTGKLFLVGDAQQSIYRFRRADPAVFATLRDEIPLAGQLQLSENFRSVPEVLHFVNHLFAKPLGNDFQSLTASAQFQVPVDQRKAIAPVVEFLWATEDVQPTNALAHSSPSADDLRNREADWIALRIAALLQEKRPTVRAQQPVGAPILRRARQGDIVILFRTLSDVPAYEAALARRGIDYYLVGGKTFYAQQEVFDLLNLCRWLDEPADEISLVGALRSPFFNLTDDAIHAMRLSGLPVATALSHAPPEWLSTSEQNRIRFAGTVLAELRELKDRLPPSELLATAIDRTGYDAALLLEHLGSRKVANLVKLVDQAAEFDDAELFTLQDYVRRLEQSVLDQTEEALAATLPEAGDVVRLMTIHQSKGLEFPVVFIADMNRRVAFRSSSALLHPRFGALLKPPEDFGQQVQHLGLEIYKFEEVPAETAEIARLLYVAATRAADRLILSAGMMPDLKADSPWMKLLEQEFHLATGLLKGDAYLGALTGGGAGSQSVPDILVHRKPPSAESQQQSSQRLVPVSELPAMVEAAEPVPLPATTLAFSPATDWLGSLSVSRLERYLPKDPLTRRAAIETEAEDQLAGAPADVVGTVIHRVLQRLDFSQTDNFREVLEASCLNECSTREERRSVAQQSVPILKSLLESDVARQLSDAKVLFREIDFLLSWPLESSSPRALLTGQMDVLFQRADHGWHIFDYKTGVFPPAVSDAELIAPYALQLGIYALAAERETGAPLKSIHLVVMRPKVRLLRFEWTAQTKNRLKTQIDQLLQIVARDQGQPLFK